MATHLSIRDLQKISGETIHALAGPTPVKAGARTIAILVPLKTADPEALAAALTRAEALAAARDRAADDALLGEVGAAGEDDWSIAATLARAAEPD